MKKLLLTLTLAAGMVAPVQANPLRGLWNRSVPFYEVFGMAAFVGFMNHRSTKALKDEIADLQAKNQEVQRDNDMMSPHVRPIGLRGVVDYVPRCPKNNN